MSDQGVRGSDQVLVDTSIRVMSPRFWEPVDLFESISCASPSSDGEDNGLFNFQHSSSLPEVRYCMLCTCIVILKMFINIVIV